MKNKFTGKIKAESRQGERINVPSESSEESTNSKTVTFSFELFDFDYQCPSEWQKDEVKQLFKTLNKASQYTWEQVQRTGGKGGNKNGLGFTNIDPDPFTRPANLSQDISISEFRVTEKARMFGARIGRTYLVLRIDRNHKICK